MKKWISILLVLILLLGTLSASFAEEKYNTLTVGSTTPFSGNFFNGIFGNNIADMDVQTLVHGYSPVYWDSTEGKYAFNDNVLSGAVTQEIKNSDCTYHLALCDDLFFNNGEKITAWDYAFSLLLLCSGEIVELTGNSAARPEIVGSTEYRDGKTEILRGVRVYNDKQIAVTISGDYRPYYYETAVLDIIPYPISEIAPGCSVFDDGNGVYISGDFSAELLKSRLVDPETGYVSHPSVSSGPYVLVSYNGNEAKLMKNPYFKGNQYGYRAGIENLVFRTVNNENMLQELVTGNVDFLTRCTQKEVIDRGIELVDRGEIQMNHYPRSGYSFFSFCCEKDTVTETAVRKAISLCVDKDAIKEEYVGEYGVRVDGDYGMGQWMVPMNAEIEQTDSKHQTEQARKDPEILLEEAGWLKDVDGIRFKMVKGNKTRLELKLIYPETNKIGDLLEENLIKPLADIGVAVEAQAIPMEQLLNSYYRIEERDCDMIYLATNYSVIYDPSSCYDPDEDNKVDNTTGLKDQQLYELALAMRGTEPGDKQTYIARWKEYQERWTELHPVIPVYSNEYYDFFIPTVKDYNGQLEYGWAEAIIGAYMSD